MHYILVAIFAFSSAAALAQTVNGPNPFKIPPQGYALTAGKPSNIQWAPNTPGTVTIKLREGASSDLNAGKVIGGQFPVPTAHFLSKHRSQTSTRPQSFHKTNLVTIALQTRSPITGCSLTLPQSTPFVTPITLWK